MEPQKARKTLKCEDEFRVDEIPGIPDYTGFIVAGSIYCTVTDYFLINKYILDTWLNVLYFLN